MPTSTQACKDDSGGWDGLNNDRARNHDMPKQMIRIALLPLLLLLFSLPARATLTTDLQALVTDLGGINTQLAAISTIPPASARSAPN